MKLSDTTFESTYLFIYSVSETTNDLYVNMVRRILHNRAIWPSDAQERAPKRNFSRVRYVVPT